MFLSTRSTASFKRKNVKKNEEKDSSPRAFLCCVISLETSTTKLREKSLKEVECERVEEFKKS